ncbi:hypothetical protein [Pandoraea horticolens]|uniref:hypothetical protein n=1 Tax=Pandoraea horticolens TaxID=2508298 RepID=UPI001FEABD63|nr:hypothetical protein [Pandoraea horticolens]
MQHQADSATPATRVVAVDALSLEIIPELAQAGVRAAHWRDAQQMARRRVFSTRCAKPIGESGEFDWRPSALPLGREMPSTCSRVTATHKPWRAQSNGAPGAPMAPGAQNPSRADAGAGDRTVA